ncbi:hypothetical protein [Sulfurimonas sp.]|uniref:hypothetical protein n=1 Tax=Sulfurimonas sp. TaxID=2022749 RepID=UPI003564311D
MKKLFQGTKEKVVALGTAGVVLAGDLSAAVIMPTADYTDIEGAAVIGFGIAITVGLLMKAKRFFA